MNPPHGGVLVDLLAAPERAAELRAKALGSPSWDLTPRQVCDLEMLLSGAFSPLAGFLGQADQATVCEHLRLQTGLLWPIPVLLDVPAGLARSLRTGDTLGLRDAEGTLLATVEVESAWERDQVQEAECVYGTTDRDHAGVAMLFREHPFAVTGRLEGLALPAHYDFAAHRHSPRVLRASLQKAGWQQIVGFQTRNPMHRAHCELARRAMQTTGANLLIHPTVGMTRPGDLDHFTRVRCYEAVLERFPAGRVALSLLPIAMRMAGPREALLHAIVRKNYGCSHLVVGRDHAGPGGDRAGRPYYTPYAAQELAAKHQRELGIEMVPLPNLAYVRETDSFLAPEEIPAGVSPLDLSGSELRRRLAGGRPLPDWFTYPEVARVLARSFRPRFQQGLTVFLTGLPAAGKSTIANVLQVKLLEIGGRPVTLLDGDLVRKYLSPDLGFSRADRDLNIRRIGFVASEITKNGGVALCAPIAPYDALRREVAALVKENGAFVLVYVSTPLATCEQRDQKGLYAKARRGLIQAFTGISDPYEAPEDADVVVDASELSPEQAADKILGYLAGQGYLDRIAEPSGDRSVSPETDSIGGPDRLPGRPAVGASAVVPGAGSPRPSSTS